MERSRRVIPASRRRRALRLVKWRAPVRSPRWPRAGRNGMAAAIPTRVPPPCLFDLPERGERCRQHDVTHAEPRLGLNGFACGNGRLFEATTMKMCKRKRNECRGAPRIEWAQSKAALRPLDRPFRVFCKRQYDPTLKIG